jgi:hypothetical protein
MAIYSVHLPADGASLESAANSVHFERQGFAWAAFFFGPLWLLARGLWRAFIVWCVIAALVIVAVSMGHLSGGAAFALALLSAFFLGVHGSSIAAAAFDRAGWRFADIVVGENRPAAERNFFSRWREEAPAARRGAMNVSSPVGVIGLFPEAGG